MCVCVCMRVSVRACLRGGACVRRRARVCLQYYTRAYIIIKYGTLILHTVQLPTYF